MLENSYCEKISLTNIDSTFDSFRNCISLAVLLEEGFLEGALRSELVIAGFEKRFKATMLSRSY